ncbi:Multidrug resistance protein MdtG [subsurface metagenome]
MKRMSEDLNSNKNLLQRIFLGLSSFQILAMFRRGLFYTYLSLYLKEYLDLSVTATTLYGTIPMILSVIGQNFVWGPLSDRIQKRRIFIVIGELSAGIGIVIVWGVHTLFTNPQDRGYFVIIGLSIIEFFWSMSNIAWSSLFSDVYPPKKRSKVMGNLTSLGGIGQMLGILIGGVFYNDGYGFEEGILFFIASAIMISSIFPMLFLVPEGGTKRSWNNPDKENISSRELEDSKEFSLVIFLSFIFALFLINAGRNSIAIVFSQFISLESGFNADSLTLSFILNTRGIATIIIGLIAGKLSKSIGLRKTLIVSSFLAVVYLLIFGLVPSLGFMYVGRFIWGAVDVLVMTSSYALASLLIPQERRGRLFGVYNASFFLSWGVGSTFIIGPLIDRLMANGIPENEAYKFGFLASAVITIVGIIMLFLALYIERKKGKNNGEQKENISEKLQD